MIFIAHRGNLEGQLPERENHPDYLKEAVSDGYDVEVDVWFDNGHIVLGHEAPKYEVNENFLTLFSDRFWCHAKTAGALKRLVELNMNCFFHHQDDVVLTSKHYLWTFPGKELVEGAIAVLPEIHDGNVDSCAGICSDFVKKYKDKLGKK